MDLKEYVGKTVLIQFRAREEWLVAFAPIGEASDENGKAPELPAPEVMMINTEDGRKVPTAFPFINGKLVDDNGTLELETGNGGTIRVTLSPEVIHSVSAVVIAAEERRIETVSEGGIIRPS